MLSPDIQQSLRQCELLAFDFDGVFTDNKVYLNEKGEEMVRCDRSDTFGLAELQKAGVKTLILSSEKNKVVRSRADKLGIDCIHGQADKATALQGVLAKHSIQSERAVYVGNDVNDLSCFALVGTAIAVADAYPVVREAADFITEHSGGNGAVREVIELVLVAQRVLAR